MITVTLDEYKAPCYVNPVDARIVEIHGDQVDIYMVNDDMDYIKELSKRIHKLKGYVNTSPEYHPPGTVVYIDGKHYNLFDITIIFNPLSCLFRSVPQKKEAGQ